MNEEIKYRNLRLSLYVGVMIPDQRHRYSVISTRVKQISLIHRLIYFLTNRVSEQGLIQLDALSLIHYHIGLVVFLFFHQLPIIH